MDVTAALAQVEAALAHQLSLAGGEEALGIDADTLLATLEPALRQMGLAVAEQARTEVAAQLPDHDVDLLISDGEPMLRVRSAAPSREASFDQLDARLTVRLPETLKRLVEEEAGEVGDSVNTWVLRTLSSVAERERGPRDRGPQRGEFRT